MISGARSVIAGFVAALFVMVHGTPAVSAPKTLSGTVSYRERVALPRSAVIEVKLVDISLADAPAKVIARTTIKPGKQVPIRYRLAFDDTAIVANHTYAIEARITVNGQLWFITTTRHTVFAGGSNDTSILVERVGGRRGAAVIDGPVGRWLAEDIRGRGVIDYLQTILVVAADGVISGTGGCNTMLGTAEMSGDSIRFGSIASTEMACTPAAMDQEEKFFSALGEVRSWRVDSMRHKLALLGADGEPVVILARM